MSDTSGPAVAGGMRAADVRRMVFDDNSLLPQLYGNHDQHLVRIEQLLNVSLSSRGNQLAIAGASEDAALARKALTALYERLKRGLAVDLADVDAAVRFAGVDSEPAGEAEAVRTRRRLIGPRSPGQRAYLEALRERDLVFGLGPAGTGKTYLAVAVAVSMLLAGKVERLVLSRPAVEAGERLGFLPGDLREKVDPYLRPLYDALHDMLPADQVANRLASGEIEIAPIAFMRGRTLAHSFVILDEAQNTTPMQMKMFLTRLGEGSRMVVTGDLTQVDLPPNVKSGLRDALDTLEGVDGVRFIHLTDRDVVRHDLVTRIVRAYEARDRRRDRPDQA
jgi:phosphate starvation-inducible PhoH-like protein